MADDNAKDELTRKVRDQVERIERARRQRKSLMAQTVYAGSVGVVFVLPIVAGAYLGRWLDSHLQVFSVRWTVSLIVLGVIVGGINVYLMLRE
jgi:ATP synthase protein I